MKNIPSTLQISCLCGIMLVLGFSHGHCQEKPYLTLDQAVKLAFERSYELQYALNKVDVSALRTHEAKLTRFPTSTVTMSENKVIDAEEFSYYDPSTGQYYIPGEGYEFNIQLRAPIYSGGKIKSQINYQESTRLLNLLDYSSLSRNLWLETVTGYFKVLEAQAEIEVRREQENSSQASLEVAEKRLAAGKGIRYEVLLEQAYLAEAKLALLTAENNCQDALRSLLLVIRDSLGNNYKLQEIPYPEELLTPKEELVSEAMQLREELPKQDLQISLTNENLKTLNAAGKPSLDFFATYTKQGSDYTQHASDDNLWTAGLSLKFSPFSNSNLVMRSSRDRINSKDYMQRNSLSWSILDSSSTKPDKLELKITLWKLKSEKQKLMDQIKNEVIEAYERQMESWSSVQAKSLKLIASEENEAIQKKRYELGLNQYKDIVDARIDVVTTRIELNTARFRYILDRANLDYAIGKKPWKTLL